MNVFHIVQLSNGWQIKTAGSASSFKRFTSAQEAVTAARLLAIACPPSQVRVHSLTGKLLAEWTYDPAPVHAALATPAASLAEEEATNSVLELAGSPS